MALGCEIDHCPWPVLRQQSGKQGGVADVALDEDMVRIPLQGRQVVHIAGVGELVQVDNGFVGCGEPVQYEVAADKASSASHKKGHGVVLSVTKKSGGIAKGWLIIHAETRAGACKNGRGREN